jgi:DNA polymerase (family 10)
VALRCDEAADALDELADLAELAGDTYPSRAFRRAARSVRQVEGPLDAALADGRIQALPGVGEGVVKRLAELAASGTMQQLVELRAKLPAGLVELTSVPGVGPKRAVVLYRQLRIDSRAKLKEACQQGKLVTVKGFGAKLQEELLHSLEAERTGQRLLLPEADRAAEQLDALLQPLARRMQWCGSLRRRRDTVGDLDCVLVPKGKAERVAEALLAQPGAQALAVGERKVSVRLGSGLQVDVRLVAPEEFGAAVVYFTGSKNHNIKLRSLALQRDLRLNEYGLFQVERPRKVRKPKGQETEAPAEPRLGKRVAGEDEEGVYAALGLPEVPPELREDAGEVEAALRGALPRLIEERHLQGDLHNHCRRSDGILSEEAWVKAAARSGLAYIGLTDHSYGPKGGLPGWGLTGQELLAHRQHVLELADRHAGKVRVLVGTEANILPDGDLDLEPAVLDQLDYVVASVHTHFQMGSAEMTRRITTALRTGRIDIFSHPTGRKIGQRGPLDYDRDAVFQAAAESKTCLELDAQPDRLDLNGELARRAKELGCRFTIDSDNHGTPGRKHLRWGLDQARRGWLSKEDVLTTLPAGAALRALTSH